MASQPHFATRLGPAGTGKIEPYEGNKGPGNLIGEAPRPEQAALDQGHGVTTDVIREVRLVGLGLLGALALASVGIGWVVAGRMLRPIERMTETAEAVSAAA